MDQAPLTPRYEWARQRRPPPAQLEEGRRERERERERENGDAYSLLLNRPLLLAPENRSLLETAQLEGRKISLLNWYVQRSWDVGQET